MRELGGNYFPCYETATLPQAHRRKSHGPEFWELFAEGLRKAGYMVKQVKDGGGMARSRCSACSSASTEWRKGFCSSFCAGVINKSSMWKQFSVQLSFNMTVLLNNEIFLAVSSISG
jgi:hypothetical protein